MVRSGLQYDAHEVRRIALEMGSRYVDAIHVPLHVSLNAQQYVPAPLTASIEKMSSGIGILGGNFDPAQTGEFAPRLDAMDGGY